MDPTALSILDAARDLGVIVESVRSFRRYYGPVPPPDAKSVLFRKVLANDAIEQVLEGPLSLAHLTVGAPYHFQRITVPLRDLDETALEKLSRAGQLSLNRAEMQAIQQHFRDLGREPTDIELETLAQTWSEHCSHKTLKGQIDFEGRRIDNLLKETIFKAYYRIFVVVSVPMTRCVSGFEANAGVVAF